MLTVVVVVSSKLRLGILGLAFRQLPASKRGSEDFLEIRPTCGVSACTTHAQVLKLSRPCPSLAQVGILLIFVRKLRPAWNL